jgi:hypothetical protein
MVDAEAVVRTYLVTVTGLTTYVSARIYAGLDWPGGYTPASGPAILFSQRAGGMYADGEGAQASSMQYQVCAESPALARSVARALYTALHNQSGAGLKLSTREVHDQLLPSPEPGWHIIYTAYRHWLAMED